MADSKIITAAVSPTTKEGWKFGFRIFIWVVIFAAIVGLVYWFVWCKDVDNKKVAAGISKAAAPYDKPADVEKLLMQSVTEIRSNPLEMKQAKTYAKNTGVAIEQVLVDSAIARAKSFGYIQ